LAFDSSIAYFWFGDFIWLVDGSWSSAGYYGASIAGLWCLGVAPFSGALLLFYGANTWRGKEFKWDWLVYALTGIALIIFPILYWYFTEIFPVGVVIIGFAPLGILISGSIAIVTSVLTFTGRRKDT